MIVRADTRSWEATIVWVASMSHADSRTTNNKTEYFDLLHGLRHAKAHGLESLHIIGDSMMIIQQQRRHVAPKAAQLASLFRQTRRLADMMLISGWIHHYRAQNKMADRAANDAMDARTSAQYEMPSERATARGIQTWLSNDIGAWIETGWPPHARHTASRPPARSG